MAWSRAVEVDAVDGTFVVRIMAPESGAGPVVLLLHEIFGITTYIERVAAALAAEGYLVAAPDLFWRAEPGVVIEGRDDASIGRAMQLGKGLDFELARVDLEACVDVLRRDPAASGPVAVVGFCLGGTLAFQLAASDHIACCVSYYGSGVPGARQLLDTITTPIMFHFGGSDPVIPRERVDLVRTAIADRADVELYEYAGAGHAFDNARVAAAAGADAAGPADADAGAAAWVRTLAFLRRCTTAS
jgi:carboxymethylenebutenolidase